MAREQNGSQVKQAIGFGALIGLAATSAGCSDSDSGAAVRGEYEHLYATVSITWNDDGDNTGYLSLLPNLEQEQVNIDDAIERAGWPSVSASNGKLLLSDGETPTMTRYSVDGDGIFREEAAVS